MKYKLEEIIVYLFKNKIRQSAFREGKIWF